MTRHAWTLVLVLSTASLTLAAPAPPQRLVTAEAVVAPPKANPREVSAKLLSGPILSATVRSSPAQSLACLREEKDPSAWLASRLRTTIDEKKGTLTIRLADCPKADAVAVLTAVVEAYKSIARQDLRAGSSAAELEIEQRQARMGRALRLKVLVGAQNARIAGGQLLMEIESALPDERSLKSALDRTVLQGPRILSAPVFGAGSR